MKHLGIITAIGLFIIIVYSLMQVLEFYGMGIDIFGSYLFFYLFLIISIYILDLN